MRIAMTPFRRTVLIRPGVNKPVLGFAIAGGTVWAGTGATTSGTRALLYGMGIGEAALSVALLIIELVRVPEWKHMERGEVPIH